MAEPRTLARADTADGEIVLRRRDGVVELIVNGVFAMDTTEVASELALADAVGSPPGRVLVGGLGLGYTAARLLDNGAEWVDVVERARPLIDWAGAGVTGQLGRLASDPRIRLHAADVVDFVTAADGRWDAIVLDVDNGPSFLIHADNAEVYAEDFLASCHTRLYPGGHLLVWCETASPDLEIALNRVFAGVELIEVPVTREGRSFDYAIYRARRGC
ncbi:MAG: hypothetical protein VB080_03860 [Propionicimonas sp.]|uniref:spermidine synthase n=1 Tax=Propionicimonas sp. TaxID=1955623 RepID=UPI002B206DA2|nr:hypothetical protein [Propionicimonas sp.]MEA4943554.1 hypothetical protein [Propionicimonas sp.]